MHGIIFAELKKFVEQGFGKEVWNKLFEEAGIRQQIYLASKAYPDEEIVALVVAAEKLSGKPAAELLEGFGEFIVPDLVGMYRSVIGVDWKTLDLIEHAEDSIHSVVRFRNPEAEPPKLRCERVSETEVVLTYDSPRKMCHVAKGIAKGVAAHYGEELAISESRCMHKGAAGCEISFKTV